MEDFISPVVITKNSDSTPKKQYGPSWIGGLPGPLVVQELLPFLNAQELATIRLICKQACEDASEDYLWLRHLHRLPQRLWSVGPGVSSLKAFSLTVEMLTRFRDFPPQTTRYEYNDLLHLCDKKELAEPLRGFARKEGVQVGQIAVCGTKIVFPVYGLNNTALPTGSTVLAVDMVSKIRQELKMSTTNFRKTPVTKVYSLNYNQSLPIDACVGEGKVFLCYRHEDSTIIDIYNAEDLGTSSTDPLMPCHTIKLYGFYPTAAGCVFKGELFLPVHQIVENERADQDQEKGIAQVRVWNISTLEENFSGGFIVPGNSKGVIDALVVDDKWIMAHTKEKTWVYDRNHEVVEGQIDSSESVNQTRFANSWIINCSNREIEMSCVLKGSEETIKFRADRIFGAEILGNYVIYSKCHAKRMEFERRVPIEAVDSDGNVKLDYFTYEGFRKYDSMGRKVKAAVSERAFLYQQDLRNIERTSRWVQDEKTIEFQFGDCTDWSPGRSKNEFQCVNGDFWIQAPRALYRITYPMPTEPIGVPPLKERRETLELLLPELTPKTMEMPKPDLTPKKPEKKKRAKKCVVS